MKGRYQRGHAMVEFALTFAVIVPLFLGAFKFGYTFYVYNLMQTQVRQGARYAAVRCFRAADATSITKFKTAVKNIVRYSTTDGTGTLIVPGLTDSNVTVNVLDINGVDADSSHTPTKVQVTVSNFTIDAVVASFTFNQKPYLQFDYVGRYAPQESEP